MCIQPKFEKSIINLENLLQRKYHVWEKYREDFKCPLNLDVEDFLKNHAERNDKYDNSKTHFILDKSDLNRILAYYTLSAKEITLNDNLLTSKTKIGKMYGMSRNTQSLKGFLVGQIGKNSFTGNPINLFSIFEEIYTMVNDCKKKIGGRFLFLECEKIDKLINMYTENGFEMLQEEYKENKGKTFVVMFKVLNFD